MKFTKEDARKELVSKIPNGGQTLSLSERSINEQLDALMPLLANEETELESFITTILPIFRTADGNVRNDVSVKVKAYIDQHPKNNPQVNQQKQTVESNDNPQLGNGDNKDLELLRRIEELEKRNADNEKQLAISQRRTQIISKMNEKGCKDNDWINELLGEINLDVEDFDLDNRVDKYIKMYNKSEAKDPKNITPKPPKLSGNDTYLDGIIKSLVAKNGAPNAQ